MRAKKNCYVIWRKFYFELHPLSLDGCFLFGFHGQVKFWRKFEGEGV